MKIESDFHLIIIMEGDNKKVKTFECVFDRKFPAGDNKWEIKIFQDLLRYKTVYLTKECEAGIAFHTSMLCDCDETVESITARVAEKYDIDVCA